MQPQAPAAVRRHRPKTLTVFAAAFAAGAVLAYGVNRVVDVHMVRVEPQVESEPIFVALRSLPQGAPITVWDVALKDWPKAMLPTTALKADVSLEGMVLRHPVREGQPLLSVQLVRDGGPLPGAGVASAAVNPQPSVGGGVSPSLPVSAAPAATPGATMAERFVPAAAADPSVTAVAAVPQPATAVPDPEPLAGVIPPSGVEPVAPHEPAVVAAPTAAASGTDIDAVVTAAPETAPEAAKAPPIVAVSQPAREEVATPVSQPVVAEPTPTVVALPPPTVPDDERAAPLTAPLPALPTTDIERSLAAFGRRNAGESAQPGSVLDRTTEPQAPEPRHTTPKLHLVVPERIALAVDASFAQQPKPSTAAERTPAVAQAQPTGTAAEATAPPGRTANRKPGARANPAPARDVPTANRPRQSTPPNRPAARPQAAARGMGGWFPQWSGSVQR